MFESEFALLRRSTMVLLAACAMPAALSAQSAREDSTDASPAGVPGWRLGLAHSPVSHASAGTLAWTCVAACVRPAAMAAEGAMAPALAIPVASRVEQASTSQGQPFGGEGEIGAALGRSADSFSMTEVREWTGEENNDATHASEGAPAVRGGTSSRAMPVFAAAAVVGLGAAMYATGQDGGAEAPRRVGAPELLPLRQPTLELDPSFAAPPAPAVTVPEPAVLSLLVVGLAGVGAGRRRRR